MKKYILSIAIIISFISGIYAQQELGTYFFKGLHQSSALNPAFDADQKMIVGLPSFYGSFHQRGLTANSILNGQFLDGITANRNQILLGTEVSVFKFSFKPKKIRYNFAHNYKLFSDLQFDNPIISLIFNGNAGLIGGTATASPFWSFATYSETVLGMTFTGDLSFGFNLKILNGMQSIFTEKSDFELGVNDDIYQLELESSLLLNSSFPIDFSDLKNIDLLSYSLFPNNYGLALDLGLAYENENFSFGLSVLDIGYLSWKEKVNNYSAEGKFIYEGASFTEIANGEFNFLDTIGGVFNFETTSNNYSKFVPAKYYANFNYNYNPNISIGALFYSHSNFNKMNGAFALNLERNWDKLHAVAIQYGVYGNNLFNLGLSGYTSLGPVQIYGVFDNVIGFFNTLGAQNVNARVGINLIFGYQKKVKNLRA